jgi:hypothetical protein
MHLNPGTLRHACNEKQTICHDSYQPLCESRTNAKKLQLTGRVPQLRQQVSSSQCLSYNSGTRLYTLERLTKLCAQAPSFCTLFVE